MNTLLVSAAGAACLSLPIFAMAALLDRYSGKASPIQRRRLWLTAVAGALVVVLSILVPHPQRDATGYWAGSDTSENVLSVAVHAAQSPGQALAALQASDAPVNRAPLRWISLFYSVGVGLVLLRWARSEIAVQRYLRSTREVQHPELLTCCNELSRSAGIRPPRLRWHRSHCSPAVAGWLRSTLLLPRCAVRWSTAERDFALLHELAHIRQRDNLWQRVITLLCALQWFNPLVWLARRRIRLLSELAADDLARTRISTSAEILLCLVRGLQTPPVPLLGMADHGLATRINALLEPPASRGSWRWRTAALIAVATVGAAVAAQPGSGGRLQGWEPQQIRWESATTAHGLFLHGEVDLEPGHLTIGDEGLLVLVSEQFDQVSACFAWRDRHDLLQWQCDGVADTQAWLDAHLSQAAPLWPHDPQSPLARYWRPSGMDGYSGSHITGIPGRSRNPDRDIIQAGWLEDDGTRAGRMWRRDGFELQFRYHPTRRELIWRFDPVGGSPHSSSDTEKRSE